MSKHIYKIITVIVAISLVLFIFLDSTHETYSFGVGIISERGSIADASAEKDGSAQSLVTVAAVVINKDFEVVRCIIDCADSTVNFTKDGKAVEGAEHKTKREKGDSYNMVTYGNAIAEWYAQADSFQKTIQGKTLDEIKALVSENGKGSQEVIDAGCTIVISDFVRAVEAAFNNARPTDLKAEPNLNIGFVTTQRNTHSTGNSNGSIVLSTTIVAVTLEEGNKVSRSFTDTVEFEYLFDSSGKCHTQSGEVTSKHQKGDSINMVENAGAVAEWYKQADAFSSTLVGKDASQIRGLLAENGKGSQEVIDAGCTIYVSDFVKAAVKATQVKKDN